MKIKYTEKTSVYLTPKQKEKVKEQAKKLGFGTRIGKYLRRLIVEGLKQDYRFQDPDGFEDTGW